MKKFFFFVFSILFIFISCQQDEKLEMKGSESKASEFITLKSGAIVEKKGDRYVWGGDMLLSPEQLKMLDETGDIIGNVLAKPGPDLSVHPVYNTPKDAGTKALGVYPTPYNLWAMVRFTYNSNLSSYQCWEIVDAMREIEAKTNIRFYNATGQPTRDPQYGFDYPYIDFVSIGPAGYSRSYIGRIGGRQPIELSTFSTTQTIIHEICHAVGMLHEQQRPDRDSYVNINTSNLTSMGLSNFQKRTTDYYYIGSYDFNSVMGYDSYAGTDFVYNTSLPMYTKKDGSAINQGWTLSNNDRMWINGLYVPYIARSDVYSELPATVYWSDNTIMTPAERLDFQAYLNNGNPYPPATGRIENDLARFR